MSDHLVDDSYVAGEDGEKVPNWRQSEKTQRLGEREREKEKKIERVFGLLTI